MASRRGTSRIAASSRRIASSPRSLASAARATASRSAPTTGAPAAPAICSRSAAGNACWSSRFPRWSRRSASTARAWSSTVRPATGRARRRFFVAENVEAISGARSHTANAPSGSSGSGGAIKEITVRTATLDSLLEEAVFGELDFVTIDVEGHELSVLEGFSTREAQAADRDPRGQHASAAITTWLGICRTHGYVHFKRTGVNEWHAQASDTELVRPNELRRFRRAKSRQRWQRRSAHFSNRLATRVGSYLPASVKRPLRRPLDLIRRSVLRK